MSLPPLPEPKFSIDHATRWSDEEMLAFGESCARMAREEAAKLCEEFATRLRSEDPNDPSSFVTAEECAAAIRKG